MMKTIAKLYNGDCLDVMDELIEKGVKVDSVITDPPYGMSFQSGHRKEQHVGYQLVVSMM